MSVGKPFTHDSSKQIWRHLKSSGEEEWAYTHNPYDDSPNRRKEREKKSLNVCRHYTEGRCNRGSTCRFHHDTRHNIIITPHSTPKISSIAPLKGLPTSPPGTSVSTPPSRSYNFPPSPMHPNNSISYNSSLSSPIKVLSASTSTIPHLQLPESFSNPCHSSTTSVVLNASVGKMSRDVAMLGTPPAPLDLYEHVPRGNCGLPLPSQQQR